MEETTRHLPPAGLGELVRTARMRRGWRLREAAREMRISAGYLSRIEMGLRCPSTVTAQRLAQHLPFTEGEWSVLRAAALADAGRAKRHPVVLPVDITAKP